MSKYRKNCKGHPGNYQTSVEARKPETYMESPNSRREKKKPRPAKSKVKSMLIIFFDV
jgi:hypothetical protein